MEVAIRKPEAQRMGFFTDTTVCIGCKACEVACKQWNDLPADDLRDSLSYDATRSLSASTWRHVRFVETLTIPDAPEPTLNLVEAALGAELDDEKGTGLPQLAGRDLQRQTVRQARRRIAQLRL